MYCKTLNSSVARGVIALPPPPPPHWPVNQNAEQEKCHIFSSTETVFFFCWNELKSDLKQLLKHIFMGGANLSKIKVTN